MCLLDSDCGGNERCCFNGCQNDCVSPGMDKCKAKTSLQLSTPSPSYLDSPPQIFNSRRAITFISHAIKSHTPLLKILLTCSLTPTLYKFGILDISYTFLDFFFFLVYGGWGGGDLRRNSSEGK